MDRHDGDFLKVTTLGAAGLGLAFGPWIGHQMIVFQAALAVVLAVVVLWKTIPSVMGRIDNITNHRAMYVGCVLAIVALFGAGGLLVLMVMIRW